MPPPPPQNKIMQPQGNCSSDSVAHLSYAPHIRRCAELQYRSARLVRRKDERGRLVFGLAGSEVEIVSERGSGGSGEGSMTVGGSGERETVKRRAKLREQIAKVRGKLHAVRQRRGAARQKRRSAGHRTAALLGYTNAGKSSLMEALCGEVRRFCCAALVLSCARV